MNEWEKRFKGKFSLMFIRLIGLFSICLGIKALIMVQDVKIIFNLIAVALFYLFFSPLAVKLPSGANWRPGMAFVLFSILYFDYRFVIFVAIPGILLVSRGSKGYWGRFFLTIGHLAIGIYGAGMIRGMLKVEFSDNLIAYIAITICLFVHFCLNRLVAAYIVSIRKHITFLKQVMILRKDLNWGYFCAYILGILMFLTFRVYSVPGLLLVILLLISIYQASTYFQKLKDMEEKVYIDVLTGAESRMSWEKFQEQMDENALERSGMVFMMDLDNFKMMNDTYGHEFGDGILKEFTDYIKKGINRKFRLFRYGGDEFILVVPAPVAEYHDVYDKVSALLFLQDQLWKQEGLAVSVSFGNAYLSEPESMMNIVRRADKLMYMNKFEKKLAGSHDHNVKVLVKTK